MLAKQHIKTFLWFFFFSEKENEQIVLFVVLQILNHWLNFIEIRVIINATFFIAELNVFHISCINFIIKILSVQNGEQFQKDWKKFLDTHYFQELKKLGWNSNKFIYFVDIFYNPSIDDIYIYFISKVTLKNKWWNKLVN